MAGQGWGLRTHVIQLDKFNSSLLLAQRLWKGEGASTPHRNHLHFTKDYFHEMRMGSSDLCSTLLQLPLAKLFGAILAHGMSNQDSLPSLLLFLEQSHSKVHFTELSLNIFRNET